MKQEVEIKITWRFVWAIYWRMLILGMAVYVPIIIIYALLWG